MANSIALAKEYLGILDEVYASSVLTADLNANPMAVKPSGRAGSFLVQKLALVGLGTYSRATGFPVGDATLTWEEKSYTADRGRSFVLDSMDAQEAQLDAIRIASEFLRTKVVPEIDAFRFSQIAKTSSIQTTTAANITTAAGALAAWDVAITALKNAHVPMTQMVAYVSVAYNNLLKANVTRYTAPGQNPDRNYEQFDGIKIVEIPADEFYTSIDLEAGATASAAGSYSMTSGAKAINFLIVDKGAVFADVKHAKPRLWTPDQNIDADAYKLDYRVYHDAWVLDNKVNGIYLHKAA